MPVQKAVQGPDDIATVHHMIHETAVCGITDTTGAVPCRSCAYVLTSSFNRSGKDGPQRGNRQDRQALQCEWIDRNCVRFAEDK